MSILWFVLMVVAYNNGIEITPVDFITVPIFYIGDTILFTRKRGGGMSRLTKRDKSGEAYFPYSFDRHIVERGFPSGRSLIGEICERLAHYEDLEEQGRLINEEDVLKFYYIDSEDKYVVGQRLDTMYYAEVTEGFSLAFYMSRYLPWGEHVVDEKSAWKEHTYCSEPREIPFTEWLKGFMEQQAKLTELKGTEE